jgi:hypothetical protein
MHIAVRSKISRACVAERRLKVPVVSKSPEEAAGHFGRLSHFVSAGSPATSAQTRQRLGWRATRPSLLAHIDRPSYFEASTEDFSNREQEGTRR